MISKFQNANTIICILSCLLSISSFTTAFLPSNLSTTATTATATATATTTFTQQSSRSLPTTLKMFHSEKTTTHQTGDIVTATFNLTPNGDFIPNPLFDDGTVTFVLNQGNYLPAIHQVISSLSTGQSSTDDIIIDAGWGDRRDDLIAEITFESAGIDPMKQDDLKVGMELYLANGMECVITEIKNESFVIDANPPLAGASYTTQITLDKVDVPPSEDKYMYQPNGGGNGNGDDSSKYQIMTIALGCFWGGELEYMRVEGVVGTALGYTQGEEVDPTYEKVCSGTTQHTEAIQLIFDPTIVSYEKLVQIGLERLGDSRTLVNQVGNDKGTQYRHGIYYHNDEQREIAERVIASYGDGCVTECKPTMKFYKAEEIHQQYLLKGGQSARKNAKETIRCYG